LSTIESTIMRFKSIADVEKRAIRKASREISRAVQETAHVFRIMIFLHSAKDFKSVLRLYGIEVSSRIE
jgi:hypothetical protein